MDLGLAGRVTIVAASSKGIGTVEEFANMVVFLASERASYITGVTVQVDGGLVRGIP